MKDLLTPLKALADESRLRILWMLEGRKLCVCEIQAVLALAQSTVSRHLQLLEDAGFIVSQRTGQWKDYRFNPNPPPSIQALLAQVRLYACGNPIADQLREGAEKVCRDELCSPMEPVNK